MEWVADLNIQGHYGGSSSAGSVWVLLYTMYKGFGTTCERSLEWLK